MKKAGRLAGVATLACAAALPAAAETLQIPGPSGPLEGEAIAVPDAEHALVIIPGSGPIDRDGNGGDVLLRTDTYRILAEALAEEGIASIRIDKRGFFGSSEAIADGNDVTIEAYARDAGDWVTRARELAPCVWLAGHSEGGLVALVAATTQHPVGLCGLILMSTGGRPVGQILIEQLGRNEAAAPLMPELESIVADLEAGQTRSARTIPEPLRALFAPSAQGFMIDLFSYDPVEVAADWGGPALILQGDADMQVTPQDADLLTQAMPKAERRILDGATHMLKMDQPGEPLATYSDPELPLHPDLVPAITEFLEDQEE